MSVYLSERTEAKLRVITKADELCDTLQLLSHDSFGLRKTPYLIRKKFVIPSGSSGQMEENYMLLCKYKASVHDDAQAIVTYLQKAASIRVPRTKKEFNDKIDAIDIAKGLCFNIRNYLTRVARLFEVDLNFFKNSIKLLNQEIDLIMGWRRAVFKMHGQLGEYL